MNEYTYLEQKNETMGENSFMKKLLKKRLNQKGLTLIELLAVIVILAIVAAIAIPAISNLINTQRDKAVLADAQTIIAGAKLANTSGSCASKTECLGTEINPYLDGIVLVDTDKVLISNWTLTWSGLATDKFSTDSDYAPTDTTITEEELIRLIETGSETVSP